VYYSDASSDGRAWAKTNLPSSAPGSRELAATVDGTNIYSGESEDGVFSTGPGTITVLQPAAYFETVAEACIGQAVQFFNYSAGGPGMTCNWTFGDGQTSTLVNPSITYAAASTYLPSLSVSNGTGSDTYTTPLPGLAIRSQLDLADSLRAVKSGSDVILSWTDLDQGETGYQVWASDTPSSGTRHGWELGPDITSATVTGYSYWRVQPVSSTHVCGDGEVGGAW
jgi:PKD repeat protein